jgi:hypothetical protein
MASLEKVGRRMRLLSDDGDPFVVLVVRSSRSLVASGRCCGRIEPLEEEVERITEWSSGDAAVS